MGRRHEQETHESNWGIGAIMLVVVILVVIGSNL